MINLFRVSFQLPKILSNKFINFIIIYLLKDLIYYGYFSILLL